MARNLKTATVESTTPATETVEAVKSPEGWAEIQGGGEVVEAKPLFPGRKITDITKWELANLRPGWKVMVQGKDQDGKFTDPVEAEVVSHREGHIELKLPSGHYTRPIPRERALFVTDRTLSNWEIEVVHDVRNDAVLNHPTSKYRTYTDLEIAQEAGRRWNALRGGNKGKAVYEGMCRASGVPVEHNPVLKTAPTSRTAGRSILKGSAKRQGIAEIETADRVDF